MKRRSFIKISALSAAAVAALGPGYAKEDKVQAGWFKNENCLYPNRDLNGPEFIQADPHVGNLVMFRNGTVAYVIKVENRRFKAIPISKETPFTEECFNQECIIFSNAYQEGT